MEGEIFINKQLFKAIIKKIWKIFLFELILVFILLYTPVRELFGTSLFFITKMIYLIYSTTLIWILYLILSHYRRISEWIKRYFKIVFLALSIMIALLSGVVYLEYLKHYVIPDFLFCIYYDEYNYKLYSFEQGCQELIVNNKEYDENQSLLYLNFNIDNKNYERFYEDGKISKTIETILVNDILIKENVPLIIDKQVITTEYLYQESAFIQNREIKFIANEKLIAIRLGRYSSILRDSNKSAYNYVVDIEKILHKPELLMSKMELVNQVYTADYLNKHQKSNINMDSYVDEVIAHFTSYVPESLINDTLHVYKSGTMNQVTEDTHLHQFRYVDSDVNAWNEYDLSMHFQYWNDDIELSNLVYKDGLLQSYSFYYFGIGIHCSQSMEYCDGVNGDTNIFRYLLIKNEPVTKVEVYYLYDNNLIKNSKIPLNEIILDGRKVELSYAPFDYYIVESLELFDEPKPYLKIK